MRKVRSGGGDDENVFSDDRRRLADLVDVATTSPLLQLDDRSLTSIKSIVRRSDANVEAVFNLLFDKLKKNHSQVRYLALLLIDELFTRSKVFRSLLVPVFETFLLLSVGFRAEFSLPPPQDRAVLLRKKGIEVVEKWKDMFGQHYKPIRLAYDYLKKTLRLEFPNAREVATLAQQQRREREERTQELLKKKLTSLKDEYQGLRAEVQSTLDEVTECLTILSDRKDDNDGVQFVVDSEDEDEFEEYGARSLRSARDEVEGQDMVPHETGENAALFDSLRDLYRLLTTRHLVQTQEWLNTLIRVDPKEERQSRDILLRDVIDLRNKLLKAREVCEGLGMERIKDGIQRDMDDVIWEEGDVLINNSAVSEAVAAAIGDETPGGVASGSSADNDLSLDLKDEVTGETEKVVDTSVKGQLLRKAPVLKWGAFLERWGSDVSVPVNPRGLEFENHWGKVDYDVMIPAEKLAEGNLRSVYYTAEIAEIRPCSAPLRNGGLCQRKDLKRCPFHGPIVPRDSVGKPLDLEEPRCQYTLKTHAGKETSCENVVANDDIARHINVESEKEADVLGLVQQVVANVRERDEEFRKKILQQKADARRQRSKRAREHNDSCLRAAAISMTNQGLGDAFEEDGMTHSRPKKPRGGLTALLRKKPTSKDRLARRLLSGRVRDATVSQLARDEEAAYRESFPNQWTMK